MARRLISLRHTHDPENMRVYMNSFKILLVVEKLTDILLFVYVRAGYCFSIPHELRW